MWDFYFKLKRKIISNNLNLLKLKNWTVVLTEYYGSDSINFTYNCILSISSDLLSLEESLSAPFDSSHARRQGFVIFDN